MIRLHLALDEISFGRLRRIMRDERRRIVAASQMRLCTPDERELYAIETDILDRFDAACENAEPVVVETASGPRAFTISTADVAACPRGSLLPAHYRDDGSCLCVDEAVR